MYIILLYLFLSLYLLLLQIKGKNNNKKIDFLLFIIVILLLVFRFNIGPDLSSYVFLFKRTQNPIQDTIMYHMNRNFAFTLLIYLCKLISKSYIFFAFIVNVISLGLIGYIILKNSKSILLSILIFIGSGFLEVYYSSGIRQSLAMVFFLFAYYQFLPKKKYFQYYVFAIIACLFHETAIISLILPFIYMNINRISKNKKRFFISSIIITLILFFLFSDMMPVLANKIGFDYSITHIFIYFTKETYSFLGISMEIVLTALIFFLYIMADKSKDTDFDFFQIITSFFALLIYIIFSRFSLVSRVCDLIQVIFIILIPNLLSKIQVNKIKVALLAFIIVLNAFLLVTDLTYKINIINEDFTVKTYPYVSIFDKDTINRYLLED